MTGRRLIIAALLLSIAADPGFAEIFEVKPGKTARQWDRVDESLASLAERGNKLVAVRTTDKGVDYLLQGPGGLYLCIEMRVGIVTLFNCAKAVPPHYVDSGSKN